jgi:glycosyltransferase involved in cell wall biosynthesis
VPRRILLLVTDLEIGGTPTVVRELAVRLHRPPDVHVEVACLSKWGPVADQIRSAGVRVTAFGATRSWQLAGVVRRLRRLLREHSIDTVFSFLVHANAVAALAKPFCRGVRFLQSIQTTQPEPRWHWKLQRVVHLAAEKVVVPSNSVSQAAQKWSDVPAEKMIVIPNAVDPDEFDQAIDPAPSGPIRIGFIGRLDPVKRVPLLLDAVSALGPDSDHPYRIEIYGEGPERVTIERRARDLGISDRVTLHGAISDPKTALATLHVLVLPSEAEGFGLVLIEAMAAGVPVVAADAPGIRDVVRHQETGLLVDPTRRRTFQAHLFGAAFVLREKLIRNGLREVRERFSWNVILPRYRALLNIE